jgi:hypothetical protein
LILLHFGLDQPAEACAEEEASRPSSPDWTKRTKCWEWMLVSAFALILWLSVQLTLFRHFQTESGAESNERYSRKVFVGGLPPDIDEGKQAYKYNRC